MRFFNSPLILSLTLANAAPSGNYTRDPTEVACAGDNVEQNIPPVYQNIEFVIPRLQSVRSPVSVSRDLMDIYSNLIGNETLEDSVYTQNSIRLQELQFERLMAHDNDLDSDKNIARADVALSWVYGILYSKVGIVPNISDERRHQLYEAKSKMTEMSTPVIKALYSAPFRPNIPAQLELENYVRSASRSLMIGRFSRDPQERRVFDIIRGLSVIVSEVNQRTESTSVAQPTFARENKSASSSTGAALVL